ncbi:pilus assembly protein [Nocardioides daeguensis]|uniref:TadE family type IV pilus minor pilin n=1 Tax=Nocardioides daeguensis TaxID=908359 RepID=UPI001C46D4B3|nr:TadE family type IV pilus minor pilin [Nocardioides daeguensis]MBV6728824.1 pilus assembly protein [Nocardioides daeguensis]MCR1773345.1 pilus assembly protein [Nocardioides daeguensis]
MSSTCSGWAERAAGRRTRPRRSHDRGAVTAELALALPVLLALTAGLVWLLAVAVAQARTVDAARETARAVARGDDAGEAVALGEQVAPDGVRLSVTRVGDRVVVRARGRMGGPGPLFGAFPGVTLRSEAVAVVEGDDSEGDG